MPSFCSSRASTAAWISLCSILTIGVLGDSPKLAFAINAQVPPVAYVDQPYEFVFSSDTFTSSNDQLVNYSLPTGPAWLSVDSANRRLFGTPNAGNVGAVSLQLEAATDEGSTLADVTLVVLENRTLTIAEDILTQLDVAGQTSTPASLFLRPFEPFSLPISKNTFDGVSDTTHFYAVMADGSPLPAWVQFDPNLVLFSGRAPPLPASIPDRQTFSLILAASNVVGFSEATVQFEIVVVTRILAFSPSRQSVKISKNGTVHITSLLDRLALDGQSVARSDLSSVVVSSAPTWLKLNDTDLSFDGEASWDVENSVFSISVTGGANNIANASISLSVEQIPGTKETFLGTYDASAGTYFTHTVQWPADIDKSAVLGIDFDPGQTFGWLRWEHSNLTLSGTVPGQQKPGEYKISIAFTSEALMRIDTLIVNITADSSTETWATTGNSPTDSSTTTPTSTTRSRTGVHDLWTPRERLILGLKIGLPLLGVVLLIAAVICIRWRRRSKRSWWPWSRTHASRTASDAVEEGEKSRGAAITDEPGRDRTSGSYSGQEAAPQVELAWASDSLLQAHNRLSKKRKLDRSSVLASSWDDLISPSLLDVEDGLAALPVVSSPRRRQSAVGYARTIEPARSKRSMYHGRPALSSSHRSGMRSRSYRSPAGSSSFHTAYLPQRMSGAGHGAGFGSLLHGQDTRSSWYTTFGSMPLADGGSRPHTVLLTAFPLPPSQSDAAVIDRPPGLGPEDGGGPTLRLVTSPSDDVVLFEDARQKYYTERARDQLAGASRFASKTSTPPRSQVLSSSNRPDKQPAPRAHRLQQPRKQMPLSSRWSSTSATRPASLYRQTSVASSGQFDSALSSESQWEDDEVAVEEMVLEEDESAMVAATGPAHRSSTGSPRAQTAAAAVSLRRPDPRQHGSPRFM